MGDRVSGKIRMGDRWVDYKRRKKWAWDKDFFFFWEKILDVWESFGRLKKNLRERKYQKRENFEDYESLQLGVIITKSFIDQYKSRVHPRQRANKFELSVFIYSFIYGFTRKLAQIVYTFSISFFFPYFMAGKKRDNSVSTINSMELQSEPKQIPRYPSNLQSTRQWILV